MSAHGFRSVFMAASVAGAALGCYLVSLNVASERAKLENVEEKIVLAQRDIRVLQTEIGTRGRLAQLERWNARFIRLSAPSADQFVEGGFQLAALVRPDKRPAIEAPVVLAAAPAGEAIGPPGRDQRRRRRLAAARRAIARAADTHAHGQLTSRATRRRRSEDAGRARNGETGEKRDGRPAGALARLPSASAKGRAPKSLPAKPKDRSTAR